MTFEEIVYNNIEKYGQTVQYSQDGETYSRTYKAFIQPLRYKNKMYLDGKHSEIGFIDTSYYLYLGPSDVNVVDYDVISRIKINNRLYDFTHAEKINLGDERLYIWAIIRRSYAN